MQVCILKTFYTTQLQKPFKQKILIYLSIL